jgi:hypothetical protein
MVIPKRQLNFICLVSQSTGAFSFPLVSRALYLQKYGRESVGTLHLAAAAAIATR